MDTASIPINLSGLYDVLLECCYFLAVMWAVPKIVRYLKSY